MTADPQRGELGWKVNLLIEAIGQVSIIAGLALTVGFIIKEIVSKESGTMPGRRVV